jgi:vitamin B12 transporter
VRAILFAAVILGGVMSAPGLSAPYPGQIPGQAPGQAPTPPPSASEYDESIVVTATLEDEEGEDVPATVTVIERREIEDRQATSVADLLRTVPGVSVARSGSPGKATSVFVRGANSNQTLVLWNGVALNDPYFGGFDWSFLPTEGVERVEVVRGPFSTLYGSQAIGGVVQVLTGGAPGVRASVEGGSDDYLRGALSGGFQRGAFRFDVAGHARRGKGRLPNDFFDGEEATARAHWTVEDAWGPTAGTLGIGLVTRANRAEVGLPFDFADGPAPNRVQEREAGQLALPVTWSSDGGLWEVAGQVGHTETDLALRDPDNPFDESDTDSERTSGRLVATRHFGIGPGDDGSWAAVGADWEREEATDRTAFGVNLDGRSQSSRAAFGELFLRSGPMTVDLGLRHDDHDSFGGETTLKVSGAWEADRLLPGLRFRGGYGEGFRAPSLGDLYFPGFGNPDLEPETTESWEAGAEWRSPGGAGAGETGRWGLSLVGFSTDFDSLIVFDFVSSRPENVGRARSRGVEAALIYERPAVAARLSATWQDAESLPGGTPLLRRPDESAEAVVTWRPLLLSGGSRDWTFNAAGRYVGERADFGRDLPSHVVLDLAASYRWTEHLAPRLRLENALDEEYEEVAGFPAPERTWVLGLALDY